MRGLGNGLKGDVYDAAFYSRVRHTPFAGNTPVSSLQGDTDCFRTSVKQSDTLVSHFSTTSCPSGDARYTYSDLDQWLLVAKQAGMVAAWHGGVPCEGYKGGGTVRTKEGTSILLHAASIEDVYAFWRGQETGSRIGSRS